MVHRGRAAWQLLRGILIRVGELADFLLATVADAAMGLLGRGI